VEQQRLCWYVTRAQKVEIQSCIRSKLSQWSYFTSNSFASHVTPKNYLWKSFEGTFPM